MTFKAKEDKTSIGECWVCGVFVCILVWNVFDACFVGGKHALFTQTKVGWMCWKCWWFRFKIFIHAQPKIDIVYKIYAINLLKNYK